MRIPTLSLAAICVIALGTAACTQAEKNEAGVKAEAAGDKAADIAAQTGEVIESGAMKTARAVEEGAGNVANSLEHKQAEAAAESRPGAVNPATDERVPAKN